MTRKITYSKELSRSLNFIANEEVKTGDYVTWDASQPGDQYGRIKKAGAGDTLAGIVELTPNKDTWGANKEVRCMVWGFGSIELGTDTIAGDPIDGYPNLICETSGSAGQMVAFTINVRR